ncbi:GNAT family N-acetyltransferase [Isoptericola sp. NPDC057191]|uniref:GNAT family N-acetyltransferase n=1 Tax=Isoptericola sp. NPDC057191 TaxID=3346041 RepID=UPI00363FC9F6
MTLTQTVTRVAHQVTAAPSAARRLRASAGEALRWRLGMYDDLQLPPFPLSGFTYLGLRARPYEESDAEWRLAFENAPGMELWENGDRPRTTRAEYEELLRWTRRRIERQRGPYLLLLEDVATGASVGDLSIWRVREHYRTAEYAIALAPDARAHGHGLVAGRLAMRWIFGTGEIGRIEITHSVENRVACYATRRLGMAVETIIPDAYSVRTGPGEERRDAGCLHSILRDDFEAGEAERLAARRPSMSPAPAPDPAPTDASR